MDEGEVFGLVGARFQSAPILGGLRKRKDTGRQAHLHAEGLVVEDKEGTVLFPHDTSRVYASDPPGFPLHEDPYPKVQWAFGSEDGARWEAGLIDRESALAQLCHAAAEESARVRLPLARARLAAGEQVDFDQVAFTAHDILEPGKRPRPWSEVVGIEFEAEGAIFLNLVDGHALMLSPLRSVADASVLVALVSERF